MTARRLVRCAFSLTLASAFLLGCGESSSDLTSPAPQFKPGGKPGGGPSAASIRMTLSGGFAGGPADGVIPKESRRLLTAEAPVVTAVTVAFANTVGTDADVDANCVYSTGSNTDLVIPDAIKAQLVTQLRGETYDRFVHAGTDKRDGIGRVWSRPLDDDTDPAHQLVELGGNSGDPPADVEVVSGDLSQDSSEWTEPLILRYTGGRVRAQGQVDGTPVSLNCANQDEVTVTLERVVP